MMIVFNETESGGDDHRPRENNLRSPRQKRSSQITVEFNNFSKSLTQFLLFLGMH
jgi:hypothetical protein